MICWDVNTMRNKTRGILVVNRFLNTKKFNELHGHLLNAAGAMGIELKILTNLDVALETPKADFALFWDKDVNAARKIELSGIPVFNSAESIAICDDKARTYIELDGKFKQPKTIISPKTFFNNPGDFEDFVDRSIEILGLPVVFKECFGSFGEQVYLCRSKEEIMTHISEKPFILQEFAEKYSGADLRLEVVGDRVAAAVERRNENDFRANVTNGGTMKKYNPTEEQKRLAVSVCKHLGLTFGGVDIFPDSTVIEVNSNAHIMNIMECTGVDIAPIIFENILSQL